MTSGFMEASLAVGVLNIGLTGILFVVYRRVYDQTKASFSLALIAFAGAFLLQNLLVVYSYLATMPLIPDGALAVPLRHRGLRGRRVRAVAWTALR